MVRITYRLSADDSEDTENFMLVETHKVVGSDIARVLVMCVLFKQYRIKTVETL